MKKNNQTTKPPQKSVLTIEWDRESAATITTLLDKWQRTGNLNLLAELVKWNPLALWFPKVFKQILALRRVLNQAGEEDLDEAGCATAAIGQEKLLPRGQKRDAEAALVNILSVWIQRMLPGYTVGPLKVKKRRGRPHHLDSEQRYQLLVEFNGLLVNLRKVEENTTSIFFKPGESQQKFVKRIAQVVQKLHLTTCWCLENSFVPGVDVETSEPWEYLSMVQRPLGEDIALNIANRAVSLNGKRVSTDKLLYSMLAFYHFNNPGESERIRGMIERAEGEYPEEHIR